MPTDEPLPRSWAASDRPIPRRILRPLRVFLATEVAGGVVLLAATAIALVWANSPFADVYHRLWRTRLQIELGGWHIGEDLGHWINDGLMALFFFVVGLEIKRELVSGELRFLKRAALPAIAALGGMLFPALIYLAFNSGGPAATGWGIPMATDIAFALGVVSLLGDRVPASLKVFLLSVAIADDIGAIVVIAVFYSEGIATQPLAVAAALTALIVALRRLGVWWVPIYVVIGTGVWLATLESGVHATIAGVMLGLLTPARPFEARGADAAVSDAREAARNPTPPLVRRLVLRARASVPVAERLEHILHPWTSYVVVPVFALANAGVSLDVGRFGAVAGSPVARGIFFGLVIGKLAGITSFTWVAVRMGLGLLPEGATWGEIVGIAAVGGIGFTVSLFVTSLAFDGRLAQEATAAILVASATASLLGWLLLKAANPPGRKEPYDDVE